MTESQLMSNKWSKQYMTASLLHSVGVAVWSLLFISEGFGITLNMSRIIAGGGAGTWLTVGYLLYIITGFVGNAVFGILVNQIPHSLNKPWYSQKLLGLHLILYNVALVGVTVQLGLAGFIGGNLTLIGAVAEIHPNIVVFVDPTCILLGIGVLSVFIFFINYLITLVK